MADYYTQFSVVTPQRDLERVEEFVEKWQKKLDEGEDDFGPEINIQVQKLSIPGLKPEIGSAWIYAEEGGNVEGAAGILQDFLTVFDYPTGVGLMLSWAGTCSKMRTDGFCGGGMVVTRGGIVASVNEFDACHQAAKAGVEVLN